MKETDGGERRGDSVRREDRIRRIVPLDYCMKGHRDLRILFHLLQNRNG